MGRNARYVQQQNERKVLANLRTASTITAPFSSHAKTYRITTPAAIPAPLTKASQPAALQPSRTAKITRLLAAKASTAVKSESEEESADAVPAGGRLWGDVTSAFFGLTSAVTSAFSSTLAASASKPSAARRSDVFDFDSLSLPSTKPQQRVASVPTPTPGTPSSSRSSPSAARNTARRPKGTHSHRPSGLPPSTPQSGPTTVYEQWQALEKQSQHAIDQPRSRRTLGTLLAPSNTPKPLLAFREAEEEARRKEREAPKERSVLKQSQPSRSEKAERRQSATAEREVQRGFLVKQRDETRTEEEETPPAAKLTSTRGKRRSESLSAAANNKRRFCDDAIPATIEFAPPAPRLSRNSQKAATPTEASAPAAVALAVQPKQPAAAAAPEANDDYCAACGHGGVLVMCAACVQAWHFGCMQSSAYDSIDEVADEWTCAHSHKKCTARTQPKLETDAVSDSDMARFQWTSQATKRREGGRRYTSFKRGDEPFRLGDVVCICTEEEQEGEGGGASSASTTDRIGELVDAWQDNYGGRVLEVRWYWLPEETRHGRLPAHHERELFGTAHMGEVDVDSIQSKVSVLAEHDYAEREARGELDDCVFFCRRNYDHDRGDFKPLVASDAMRAGAGKRKRGRKGAEDEYANDDEWELDGAGGKARKHRRTADSGASTFSKACSALQLSSLPASLPCREEEAAKVRNFLTSALRRGGQHGGGLYIAGVPGTGKTATVRQVLGELARKSTGDADVLDGDRSAVPLFQFVEVNGMKLPDPSHAFTHIWQSLTGQHASPKRALSLLDARFRAKASRRPVCVLLLDEIDFCLTRSQQLLYALSDWPTHAHSRLVTLSISNTIDFPELLHERVRSRFIGEHVTFRPYKSVQVEEIIRARLEAAGQGSGRLFEKDAITYAAKKIASINGDIRVALEICRRAAIIAQEQQLSKARQAADGGEGGKGDCVTMRVVQRAIAELQGSSEQEMTRQCTPYQAALLATIYQCNVASSADAAVAVDFNGVSDRLRRAYLHRGGLLLNASEVEGMANDMVAVGLLEWVGRGKGELSGLQVRMKMPPHLCEHALKDNVHWQSIVS